MIGEWGSQNSQDSTATVQEPTEETQSWSAPLAEFWKPGYRAVYLEMVQGLMGKGSKNLALGGIAFLWHKVTTQCERGEKAGEQRDCLTFASAMQTEPLQLWMQQLAKSQWECFGFPWWLSTKECACQCKRCGFDPWVRKIPWKRKW